MDNSVQHVKRFGDVSIPDAILLEQAYPYIEKTS